MSETFAVGASSARLVGEALQNVLPPRPHLEGTEAALALLSYALIFPELKSYRGGWYRAGRFDADSVDIWFETCAGDVAAVERMINHLDVFVDFPACGATYEIAEAAALARVLTYAWPAWALDRYGIHIQCGVAWADDSNESEPHSVTFWTASEHSGAI